MNNRKLFSILIAELILGVILLTAFSVFTEHFSSLLAFPFEQIGLGLRVLSFSGRIGNCVAWILYTFICLLPLYSVLRHCREKSRRIEHIIRILLSGILFFTMFCMINPGMFIRLSPVPVAETLSAMKSVFGGTAWSLLVSIWIVRLTGMFREGEKEMLLIYLKRFLYMLCALFTAAIALSISGMISAISSSPSIGAGINAVLRCTAAVLPYFMDIAVTITAAGLIDAMMNPEKAADVVPYARKLSSFCCYALVIVTVSCSLYNIVQIFLSRLITDIQIYVEIPLISLAFVLLTLLLSRLIIENKKLADDNDLFI